MKGTWLLNMKNPARIAVITPMFVLSMLTIYTLYMVLVGKIGNFEIWRILLATTGATLIIGLSIIFSFKLISTK